MISTIRFLRPHRQYVAGDTDSQMDYGVMDALVTRHIAEWVTDAHHKPSTDSPQRQTRRSQKETKSD